MTAKLSVSGCECACGSWEGEWDVNYQSGERGVWSSGTRSMGRGGEKKENRERNETREYKDKGRKRKGWENRQIRARGWERKGKRDERRQGDERAVYRRGPGQGKVRRGGEGRRRDQVDSRQVEQHDEGKRAPLFTSTEALITPSVDKLEGY